MKDEAGQVTQSTYPGTNGYSGAETEMIQKWNNPNNDTKLPYETCWHGDDDVYKIHRWRKCNTLVAKSHPQLYSVELPGFYAVFQVILSFHIHESNEEV